MSLKITLITFSLLFFRQVSAADVQSVVLKKDSPQSEAQFCYHCPSTSSHLSTPELGGEIDKTRKDIENRLANAIRSKGSTMRAKDVARIALDPQIRYIGQELKEKIKIPGLELIDQPDAIGDNSSIRSETYSHHEEQLASQSSLPQQQSSNSAIFGIAAGPILGVGFKSNPGIAGLKFNLSAGQELRHLTSGTVMVGSVERSFTQKEDLVGKIYTRAGGQKTMTFCYRYRFD